jgi:hypothetical protein
MNMLFVSNLQKIHSEAVRDWHSRSMGFFCTDDTYIKLPGLLGIETDPDRPLPRDGEIFGIPVRVSPFAPAGKLSLVLTHCRHCGNDFMTYGVCPTCGNQTEMKIITVELPA